MEAKPNAPQGSPDAAYVIRDPAGLLSPSLVVFREIVASNLAAMIATARSPERLRPHVKTHKMPAVVRMVESLGITRHKCATIAEAEMVARAGGSDVLIAYPLVGPNVGRLVTLAERYPMTTFRATVEDAPAARALSEAVETRGVEPIPTLVDLDVGMGRTGARLEDAASLYRQVADLPGLQPDGLHAYDGHARESDPEDRRRAAEGRIRSVLALRRELEAEGFPVPRLVLGGTPSFPMHAALDAPGVECSAGTAPFFDMGYASRYPDLPFRPAALVLTRVVSGPRGDRITLDLGHKAVAADPPGDRLRLVGLPHAKFGPQSEEHLVVELPSQPNLRPVGVLLAVPTHVCPTVALHAWAYVVEGGEVVDRWEVAARDRVIGI